MGQILVEGGEVAANLARAGAAILEAARLGCDIVVLPECLDAGWTFPGSRELAKPVPGEVSDAIARAAKDARMWVVAGLTERDGERVYNAAVLISPDGSILLKHRKLNELSLAHGVYDTGDRLGVAATPFGTIGITICADNFPDSLVFAHALGRMGCQLLLSPCAWAVDGDHDNTRQPYGDLWIGSYTTAARLYDMAVIGVSNVGWLRAGPWSGRKCIGCSLAIGPGGKRLAMGPYGESAEALIPVEVELSTPIGRGTDIADRLRARGYQGH
jgi:predicted amidohydrolase